MRRLIHFSILLFPLLAISSFALSDNRSKIDSLKALNRVETNGEEIANNLSSIADLYSLTNIDSAFFYANKALDYSKTINYNAGIGEAFFLLAYYHDQAGEFTKAIKNLEMASEMFIEVGDTSYLCGTYNNLGVLYSYTTNRVKSLEYYIKAMVLAEDIGENYSMSDIYCNIATTYEDLKDYSSALRYYHKGLELDLEEDYAENIAYSYVDIGNINLKLLRFDHALENFLEARKLMPKIEDQYREIELYIGFVSYYLETNNLDSARTYLQLSEKLNENLNYPALKAEIIGVNGDLHFKEKNYKQSLKFYNQAIRSYSELESKDSFYDLYLKKSQVLSKLGKHSEAFNVLEMANNIMDSIKPNDIARMLGEFEQMEAIKEEQAQFLLEQELDAQQIKLTIFRIRYKLQLAVFSIAILLLVIAAGTYYYIFKRNNNRRLEVNFKTISEQKKQIEESFEKLANSEKKLIELNATKDKFFSIIAHDLKSPFSALIGLSDIILRDPGIRKTDDFNEILDGMFRTATSGYNLLENLLEWARAQTGNIKHKPDSFFIKDAVQLNANLLKENASSKGIQFDINIKDDQKVFADADMANCIIRNLLNNAIKFSYPNSWIKVSSFEENGSCIIEVHDKGIGMSKDTISKLFKIENSVISSGTANEKGTGLGLILCKEFVEKNKGKIWVESTKEEGSTFSFSLPLVESAINNPVLFRT